MAGDRNQVVQGQEFERALIVRVGGFLSQGEAVSTWSDSPE